MEITERYIVDLDPKLETLRQRGRTYGQGLRYRGVLIDITGAATWEEAMELVQREVDRRGWQWRERWWQFWRPEKPAS